MRNVAARHIDIGEAGSVAMLRGDPELPARDFTLEDVKIGRVRAKMVEAANVENLRIDGLEVRIPPVVPLKKDDPSRGGQEK